MPAKTFGKPTALSQIYTNKTIEPHLSRLSDLQFLGNFRLFERSEFENFR